MEKTIERIKSMSDDELLQMLDMAELALGGDKGAKEALSTLCGSIETAGDIWRIMMVVQKQMSTIAKNKSHSNIGSRLTKPPIKPKVSKLALLRAKAGLTQAELAEKSGVNVRQIRRYESGTSAMGNMTLSNAIAIANALGVSPLDLV